MQQGLQPLEQQLNLPAQSIQGHHLERRQFCGVERGHNPEDFAGPCARRDGTS
jgi:hypothetical protein